MTSNISSVAVLPNILVTFLVLATWVYYRTPALPRDLPEQRSIQPATFAPSDCDRPCIDGQVKECYFHFVIKSQPWTRLHCSDTQQNDSSCSQYNSLPLMREGFYSVNGQSPGPAIQVCKKDIIIVDVVNRLYGEEMSIHWHGIYQNHTPYMDGVPMITQCPIPSNSRFRYAFRADNAGTHFYHAHSANQFASGVFGALIVKELENEDLHTSLYNFDLEEHVVLISLSKQSTDKFYFDSQKNEDKRLSLIVGASQEKIVETKKETKRKFYVENDLKYRFRIINAISHRCSAKFEIDNHLLTIINKDGNPIKPVLVNSVLLYPGERYDIVLHADQEPSIYEVRVTGNNGCEGLHESTALVYEYGNYTEFSKEIAKMNNEQITSAVETNSQGGIPDLKGLFNIQQPALKSYDPYATFYMSYDLSFQKDFDNKLSFKYHHLKLPYYPSYLSLNSDDAQVYQFNNISFTYPPSPLLSQRTNVPHSVLCNTDLSEKPTCEDFSEVGFCECVYIINVPMHKTVDIVLVDEGVRGSQIQTFHLHGYSFYTLAMERFNESINSKEIRHMNEGGKLKKNIADPPKMDTISVPNKGYVILRLHTDNPGYWLMESQNSRDEDNASLQFVLHVGGNSDIPPVPKNFPQCGTFKGPDFLFT